MGDLYPLRRRSRREEGFAAVGHDAFNIVTNVSSGFRIIVPRHQSETAGRLLDQILTA